MRKVIQYLVAILLLILSWTLTAPVMDGLAELGLGKEVHSTYEVPLPHQVPHREDVLSLRFAMVHDVLVERYKRHSSAWYWQRNENVKRKLNHISEKSEPGNIAEMFDLYDNLAAGHARLGNNREAIYLMNEKKFLQKNLEVPREDRYRTHANLGTFLVHHYMEDAMRNRKDAIKKVRDGLEHLRTAIEIKPGAHFGREVWQVRIIEFLLAAMDEPKLLKQYDFVGNALDKQVNPLNRSALSISGDRYGYKMRGRRFNELNNSKRKMIRDFVSRLSIDANYMKSLGKDPSRMNVAFDRPVLGIIGMWRLGGGPNPHFALALAEIMLRVGQRRIAWQAYERARLMKKSFWPSPDLQAFLEQHCRKRQNQIEETMSAEEVRTMSRRFHRELEFGRAWQKKYHRFEKNRIDEGVPITRDDFHDPFYEEHESVASDPGKADWVQVTQTQNRFVNTPKGGAISFLLVFGFFVFLTGVTVTAYDQLRR